MRKKREMVLWSLVCTLGLAGAAPGGELLRAAAEDLVPAKLVVPAPATLATAERSELAYSWPVPAGTALEAAPAPQRTASREYWVAVEAAELVRGIELFTTAPGALVRLQPAGRTDGRSIDPRDLTLVAPDGRELAVPEAAEALASAEQLAAADAPFVEGTSAFRLNDALGAGRFLLRAAEPAAGRYVVHVFDRGSTLALVVESARANYLAGEELALGARFFDGDGVLAAERLDGFVVSPAGRVIPIAVRRAPDGGFAASATLPGEVESGAEGLWELVASARGVAGGKTVLRSARVAFAVATPTARLDGSAELQALRRGEVAVRCGVEAVVAGRYELRGVLWGADARGVARPAAVAHTAAWLEAGAGSGLTLRFDPAAVKGSGLSAPWELRALELRDQGRMGLLERRARALAP